MNQYQTFYQLHQRPGGFILGNVWDAASAQLSQEAGFAALGTSSAAMAHAMGYVDGENIPFETLLQQVARIQAVADRPLSVDIEGGYNRDPQVILKHILALAELGVVGINIEDSVVTQQRELLPADVFAETLSAIKQGLSDQDVEMFINVRSDVCLLNAGDSLEAVLARLNTYQNSGADGLFVPGLTDTHHIQTIVNAQQVPLNVMSLPNLTDVESLRALGVKRFSMGNFAYAACQQYLSRLLKDVHDNQSFGLLFSHEQK